MVQYVCIQLKEGKDATLVEGCGCGIQGQSSPKSLQLQTRRKSTGGYSAAPRFARNYSRRGARQKDTEIRGLGLIALVLLLKKFIKVPIPRPATSLEVSKKDKREGGNFEPYMYQ